MDEVTREVIAVAASIGAGCPSCLETHWRAAKRLGATDEDLADVVQTARAVRVTALLNMDSWVNDLNRQIEIPLLTGPSNGCGPDCSC